MDLHAERRDGQFQRPRQLRISGRERGSRLCRQAAIAEQQAQRIRVHRHIALNELDGRDERELKAVRVEGTEVPDHLVCPHRSPAATSLVILGPHGPQVLGARDSGGTILSSNAEDRTDTLWIDPDDRGRHAVRADNQIADLEVSKSSPPHWREHS